MKDILHFIRGENELSLWIDRSETRRNQNAGTAFLTITASKQGLVFLASAILAFSASGCRTMRISDVPVFPEGVKSKETVQHHVTSGTMASNKKMGRVNASGINQNAVHLLCESNGSNRP